MPPERAAAVLKEFSDAEAEDIASEIIKMRRVSTEDTDQAISEFYEMAMHGHVEARGGRSFAAGLLEASFGADKAAGLMNRVTSTMAGKSFEFLDEAEPAQILTLIDSEMPQTIALVLAHLRTAQASTVLAGLPDDIRIHVARCIATMTSATPETIAMVSQSLRSRAAGVVSPRSTAEVVGGIQPLVDIISRSDINTERAVLEGLDAQDPELAEEIRSRMLTFADIVKLEARDIQQVLRGVSNVALAIAMRGAPEVVTTKIRENLSERNRELLEDEIASMGPVRISQVEEARAEVVRAIRELEESGGITLHRGDEDAFVE
jgi:flagellar motor switch protein FliG